MSNTVLFLPAPEAFDGDWSARPNSLCAVPGEIRAPQPQPAASLVEEGRHHPILLTCRLVDGQITARVAGRDRTYQLHDLAGRSARLPQGAPVHVRICQSTPRHAEVYENGITRHHFLGHAIAAA